MTVLFADVVLVPLLVLLGIGVWLLIRFAARSAYSAACRRFGWQYEHDPGLEVTFPLNRPPFGVGLERKADDFVWGTVGALPFSRFDYSCDQGAQTPVAVFRLPRALPEVFITRPGRERPFAEGVRTVTGGWSIIAPTAEIGDEAARVLVPVLDREAGPSGVVDLSLDGPCVVFLDAPRIPKELAPWAEASARIAQAASALAVTGPTFVPPEASFYHRPTWTYRASDPPLLASIEHQRGGSEHQARDAIFGTEGGIPFVGFMHRWVTESTDSDGNTTTSHHKEPILELMLPWPFADLSLDWRGTGDKVQFESEQFNQAFTVRAENAKFAYDVMHPRQMEYLMGTRPLPFRVRGGRMRFAVDRNDPGLIFACMQFAVGFFARVPSFVWENLGLDDPPQELAEFDDPVR